MFDLHHIGLEAARAIAHDTFDVLWKSGRMSRTQAYAALARHLRLSKDDCHIKRFGVDQCIETIRWAKNA